MIALVSYTLRLEYVKHELRCDLLALKSEKRLLCTAIDFKMKIIHCSQFTDSDNLVLRSYYKNEHSCQIDRSLAKTIVVRENWNP